MKRQTRNWRAHVVGGIIGFIALVAAFKLPEQKSWIQLCVVTITAGYLAVGDVWELRRKPGFLRGIGTAIALHAVVSAVLWQFLPIHILTLLMIAGIEGIALLLILYKLLDVTE